MFSYLFSNNKVSNNISPEKVVNNSTTYAGIKVSDATFNYFASATKHFADATTAAASCGAYATLTATYAAKTAIQGVLGLCAYKEFAAEVMTGHAFGIVMPEVVKTVIGTAASAIYSLSYSCYGNLCHSSSCSFTGKCSKNCRECSLYSDESSRVCISRCSWYSKCSSRCWTFCL